MIFLTFSILYENMAYFVKAVLTHNLFWGSYDEITELQIEIININTQDFQRI